MQASSTLNKMPPSKIEKKSYLSSTSSTSSTVQAKTGLLKDKELAPSSSSGRLRARPGIGNQYSSMFKQVPSKTSTTSSSELPKPKIPSTRISLRKDNLDKK